MSSGARTGEELADALEADVERRDEQPSGDRSRESADEPLVLRFMNTR